MTKRGESRLADALPDLVTTLISKAASLAALSLVVTFGYFLYALFSGYVRAYPQLAVAQQWKVYTNLTVASHIFVVAAALLTLYALLHLWEHNQFAGALALVGVVFYFGAPLVIAQALGAALRGNGAAWAIQKGFANAGQIMLVAAIVWGIPALIAQVRTGFSGFGADSASRRAARKQQGLTHPLSPCWRLPYCRPYIREKCVRFQERKTCWRRKSGCMCDEEIMAAALMSGSETSSGAREKLITEFLPGAGNRGSAKRKVTCANCFIYLEHQRLKHKFLAPVMVPLVVLIFWHFSNPIQTLYLRFGAWATHAIASVALGQMDTSLLQQTFTNPAVKWLILACAGIYLLTYLLRFVEFLFFKLKI